MRTRSLRLRVIVGVLVTLAVALLAVGFVVERTLSSQLRGDLQQRLVDRVGYGQLLTAQGADIDALPQILDSDGIFVTVRGGDGETNTAEPRPARGAPGPGGGPPTVPHAPPSVVKAVDVSSDSRGIVATLSTTDGGSITATGSTYEISQTLERLRTIELVAGAVMLAVVALLLTGVVSVALRPLSRMTELARGIARGGRGERLHPDKPTTELGRTAEAFDEMLNSLEAAEHEARAAAAAATAAEERMRRLLADVSHELRTPIAALQARAESLLRENPPRARREDLALGMVRDTRRAARLVDDLLLMNRLEHAPGDQLRRRPVDLAAVVRGVVDEQRVLEPGVRVEADTAGTVEVIGDPERLGQVVANLISNARRAVGGHGDVVASVRSDATTAVVEVVDTGPGVPEADRERVFDRFVRLDAARTRADGGSGLGLAISRALARAHGGDLVLAPSDHGARFVVTVPLAAPVVEPAGPTPQSALV
ncbi:HAMP domain-containing sensor histidine kinase [Jatrophihabitans sp. YIM 134969]